jgi:hypothetical protein
MNAARLRPGAISDSSSSHLPASDRLVEPSDDAVGDGLPNARKDNRDRLPG